MDNKSNIFFFILAPSCGTFCKLVHFLLGDRLEESEWIVVIINGRIGTRGLSKAILSATHVKKT